MLNSCVRGSRQGVDRGSQRTVHKCRLLCKLVVLVCTVSAFPVVADEYDDALAAEARKVEARSIDTEKGESVVEALPQAAGDAGDSPSRDRFEALLRQRYAGTFTFYKKLPERSREEIFEEYRKGASMTVVRKKIIDRLLQR